MQNLHTSNDIEFSWLKDFLAVIECGSFNQAANIRFISQPALSRRIQSLEFALGATLIDRSQQPAKPTRAGAAFLPFAKEALREVAEGAEFFRSVLSGFKDPITVAATHTVAISFLPGWLESMNQTKELKGWVVNAFRTERCIAEIIANRADIAICLMPENTPFEIGADLESVTLATDSLVPVKLASNNTWKLGSKDKVPLLSFSPGSSLAGAVRTLIESKKSTARNLNAAFESPSSEVLKAMTLQGFGISWLPQMLIKEEIKSKSLTVMADKSWIIPLQIKIFRKKENVSAALDILWNKIIE